MAEAVWANDADPDRLACFRPTWPTAARATPLRVNTLTAQKLLAGMALIREESLRRLVDLRCLRLPECPCCRLPSMAVSLRGVLYGVPARLPLPPPVHTTGPAAIRRARALKYHSTAYVA